MNSFTFLFLALLSLSSVLFFFDILGGPNSSGSVRDSSRLRSYRGSRLDTNTGGRDSPSSTDSILRSFTSRRRKRNSTSREQRLDRDVDSIEAYRR